MRLLKIKWAMIFNKSRSCWSADSNNNHNQIVHVLQVKLNLVAINNSRAMSETAQTSAVSENRCHCHYSLYFVIYRHYFKYIFWQTPPPSLPSVEIPSSRRRRLSQASRTRLHLDRDDGDDITRSDVWRHHCVVAQAFNCAIAHDLDVTTFTFILVTCSLSLERSFKLDITWLCVWFQ